MGLDITAYSRLTHIGKHGTEEWCEDENHVQAYAYMTFPQSFRGIPVLSARGEFLEGGCYATTDGTKCHGFRAGSYGGYNTWRANLQDQFNPDRDPAGPFYELIWFADNEGTIGPEAARDLLADFREHVEAYVLPSLWPTELYGDWTRAFELAADSGLVSFH